MPRAYETPDGEWRKVCSKCGEDKPAEDFYFRDGKPRAPCRKCANARTAEYAKNNPDVRKRAQANYYARNREAENFRNRIYRQENAEKIRDRALSRQYGVSLAWLRRTLERQRGQCRFSHCDNELVIGGAENNLGVDHDHSCCPGSTTCGKCVRGLVCHHCNMAIGQLQDNAELMREIADYLDGDDMRTELPA